MRKINRKCQLSSRCMLCESANFSSFFPFAHRGRGKRLGAQTEAPHQQLDEGGLLWWMFIKYLCLQAERTIVLSETLTFSILQRLGASYKVHCEKGVLTLRMIWRTEIPLSFIIYPCWPRGRQAVALSYLTG